ncbi:MAG: dual specificity protein phosphatase family protein [Polyangiaceae bacterium]|nr:dual specificity protein phosphatase family protein [Polyangiaceae bacterium]
MRRLPIVDGRVPTRDAEVHALLDWMDDRVAEGVRVAIHCMGGLGRTGTIAGCYLVRRGIAPAQALSTLKQVRSPKCPENRTQVAYIKRFAESARLRAPSAREAASGGAAKSPWYATDPELLGDPKRVAQLELALRGSRGGASALAQRLEAAVAKAPAACFAFDGEGNATLRVGDETFAAGRFAVPSIAELRDAARRARARDGEEAPPGKVRLSLLAGAHVLTDIGTLQASAPPGVVFLVASQFDCLEAPGPAIVKVADYPSDPTQGPRASISALPGTLLRHYRAPRWDGGRFVQTAANCLDLLGDAVDEPTATVRCGYLRPSDIPSMPKLAERLAANFERIRVGVHDEVEVLFGNDWGGPVALPHPRIAQVFTSTLALGGYGRDDGSEATRDVCRSLLRAAYLGTLLAACALCKHTVVLTLIGGGVFGNRHDDIWEAIRFALAEIDALVGSAFHVVVNTRQPPGAIALSLVRDRGGFHAQLEPASQ